MKPDPFPDRSLAVPALQIKNLQQFRREAQMRRVEHNQSNWEYIKAGKGEPSMLLLPGILGTAESAWQLITHFSRRCRVIAPNYPPLDTNKALADGVAGILDQEGIERSVVFGGSYGGFVAQVFVRCHPERVGKLILSHTTTPNPRRGRAVRAASSLVDWIPMPLLGRLFQRSLSSLMRTPDRNLRRSVQMYFRELARPHISRQHIASTYRRVADYDTRWVFRSDDLQDWPGKILLLISEDDPLTPPRVRAALQALYPQAGLRLFSGTGHLSSILRQDEFVKVIEKFMDEE